MTSTKKAYRSYSHVRGKPIVCMILKWRPTSWKETLLLTSDINPTLTHCLVLDHQALTFSQLAN